MTVFQLFRLWARRAPVPERLIAFFGAALVVAVLGWLVVPASEQHSNVVAAGQGVSAVGDQGTTTTTGVENVSATTLATGGGGGAVSGPGGAGGGGAGGGTGVQGTGGGCVSPPGSDQGVTASQLRVAVVLINLAGGVSNSAVGFASVSEQQQDFEQVIAAVNAAGGVACRKIAPTFYSPNIVDQGAVQQTCYDIVQSKVLAVIDLGAFGHYPAIAACLPKAGIPIFTSIGVPAKTTRDYYPYFFTFLRQDIVFRNAVFALKGMGFFSASNGFQKLGISYQDCQPEFLPEFEGWLHQVGVPQSQIVTFDVGCPSAQTPPNVVEQEVLTFKSQGVTHVTFLSDQATYYTFTSIAQQQQYKPKYGIPNDTEVSLSSPALDYNNLDGAIAIDAARDAEENTPGMTPSSGTQRCNAIYAANHRPTVWQQEASAGGAPGLACNLIWMFAAAVDHAPALQRNAFAAGLKTARSVDFSWPQGPSDFTGDRVTAGGEFWRTVRAFASCKCWRVTDPVFHPSFP
jgi:hypothetical protein